MTVGEVIALLTKYCSDEDTFLMCKSICSIDVYDNSITVYTVDGKSDVTICARVEGVEHEIDNRKE